MPPIPGFVGPSYTAVSPAIDVERCVNLYPEIAEAPGGKGPAALIGTPGLSIFATLPGGGPIRGLFQQDGRAFAVSYTNFCELHADGSFTNYGNVTPNDNRPVYMASNGVAGHQIMIVSGASGWIFDTKSNTLSRITSGNFPQMKAGPMIFSDGYFIVLKNVDSTFAISGLEDGTSWSGLDVGQRSEGSDQFVSLGINQRAMWLFGSQSSEVWYDNGDNSFPFAPVPGVFVQDGIVGPNAVVQGFDNTIAWISTGNAGGRVCHIANGYTPVRISTFGVEAAWNSYSTVADAVGWTYREEGHEFLVWVFPSANATWVYDAATKMWHERAWLNPATGQFEAHRAWCHCYAFDKHLVGDRQNGNVYVQALTLYDDAGNPIRSVRRTPYIGQENRWMFHSRFELELEAGVGTASGQGAAPQAMLRWSNDGRSWSSEYAVPIGGFGAFGTRAIWRRLGRARWRNYEVAVSDPVRRAWLNAYVDVSPGSS